MLGVFWNEKVFAVSLHFESLTSFVFSPSSLSCQSEVDWNLQLHTILLYEAVLSGTYLIIRVFK